MMKISEAKAKPSGGVVPHSLPVPKKILSAFAVLFVSASIYYLMMIWRDKTRRSSPLLKHLGQGEMAAILLAALASLICSNLCGFFFTTIQEIEIDVGPWHQGAKVEELTIPIPKAEMAMMNDEEIAWAVSKGMVAPHSLEAEVGGDCLRAARIRRRWVELFLSDSAGRILSLEALPLSGFNYNSVVGQCCEMVIGYVQIPVGVAGPLLLDGYPYMLPLATTEGTLVASTNRGCKAIRLSGGATTTLLRDAITRAPVLRFPSASRAASLKSYLEHPCNFHHLARLFNSTSGYARLQSIKCALAGRNLYARFACSTGDAMGMNMVTKAVQTVLSTLQQDFSDMEVVSISGNYCADKKAAAVNWIEGRGKSVVCEATIKGKVVSSMFKTSVSRLVELNTVKNLIGSCVAGAMGGSNAHASNIVSALFIATGQDPAQNVESSQCLTLFEPTNSAEDLYISVTMPCIEVGTIGGGTKLASQGACLDILGVKGANKSKPGENSQRLARIVAGAVLAGELSLMAAQATGDLVRSHMKYNRSCNE